MIAFKKLKIHNFKAIKDAELTYDNGIWLVVGENNDAAFDSNGARQKYDHGSNPAMPI